MLALVTILFLLWLFGWLMFGNGLIHGILVIAVIVLVVDYINREKK